MDFLKRQFVGNTILDYAYTLAVIIAGIAIVFAIKTIVFSKLARKAKRTENKFDDLLVAILGKTLIPALYYGVAYVSVQHLRLNETFAKTLDVTGVVILTFLGMRFLISIASYLLENCWIKKVSDDAKAKNIKSVMPILKAIVYGLGIFFLLDNLGFKISTLVAGLGIGGVAVALAGQAILGDMFSYFSILFDRPFEIGDFIIVDNYLGAIEHIGIKTTRIRSLGGEQLVFSNTDLTNSRVRNYKRMEQRRVLFQIGVVYQTPAGKLKEIPQIIKGVIEGIEGTKFDRAHFSSYGDFSLNFESVYYVFGADYNKYMDIQQQINLSLYEEFERRGIAFAYPTQTLFLNKAGPLTT